MDGLIGFLVIVILFVGIGRVLGWLGAASKATVNTISGKGTLTENLATEFKEMGAFELRAATKEIEISGRMVPCTEIEARGLIHATRNADLALVTSAFDFTEGEWSPVLSSLDFFQEPNTDAFQNNIAAGAISPNQGYKRWVSVARLFPETLTGKRSGKRTIRILVRGVPKEEVRKIRLGLHEKDTETFCSAILDVDLMLQEKGWLEAIEERNEARALGVKVAIAVAMSDGVLTDKAGVAIKTWMLREISKLDGDEAQAVKSLMNNALKEGFAQCQNGSFRITEQCQRLRELAFRSVSQSLVELLMEITTASGSSAAQVAAVRRVGALLDIDYAEIQAMSDKTLLQMEDLPDSEESVEALLGIDRSWDKEVIRQYIASEFVKWNGRIHALETGKEKEKAQRMLEAIAKARTKYG